MGRFLSFTVLTLTALVVMNTSLVLGLSEQYSTSDKASELKDLNLTGLAEADGEPGTDRNGRKLKLKKPQTRPPLPKKQPENRTRNFFYPPCYYYSYHCAMYSAYAHPFYGFGFRPWLFTYRPRPQSQEQKPDRRAEYEEDNIGYAAVLG